MATALTDVQEKKQKGMKNKIDRLTIENWGSKDIFIKYITKNNLYKGSRSSLVNLKLDKLKDIILKEHSGLSPIKSPVSSPVRKSPKSSPLKKSPTTYEIDPSTKKKRKSCKKNQIRNPVTGRCNINKNYKSSASSSSRKSPSSSSRKSSASSRKSPSSSSRKSSASSRKSSASSSRKSSASSRKSPPKYEIDPSTKKKRKSCKKNQIRNPVTGRCNINKNYKSPTSSPLKKSGMITCNKCGSLILKIKLKKHQESSKCKNSPISSSSSVDTPIKRKKRNRKIITDDDSDDENIISSPKSVYSNQSTLTPIIRRRTRKFIIDDESEEEKEEDVYLPSVEREEKEEDILQNIQQSIQPQREEDEDEEEEEEDEDVYLPSIENAEEDEDDDYVSEKSILEEGDEIEEAEEIDDINDIDSKLNEINNIVLKNDKVIKNKILRHLGLL